MTEFEKLLSETLGVIIEDETKRTQIITDITTAQIKSEAGLVNKRDELLKETKGLKESLQTATVSLSAFGTATPDEIDKLRKSNEELLKNPGDEEKIAQIQKQHTAILVDRDAASQKQFDNFKSELAVKDAAYDKLNGKVNEDLKRRELSAALDRVSVHPRSKFDLVRSLLYDVTIDQVGDTKKVKINIDGTPFDIESGIELWSRNPRNEHNISATPNQGAGGGGSKGSVSLADKPLSEMTISEKNQYARENLQGFLAKKAAENG